MAGLDGELSAHKRLKAAGVIAALTAALLASGCAQLGGSELAGLLATSGPPAVPGSEPQSQTDLQRATEYWGKEYSSNPRDLNAALSYAKNLKAIGQKAQALDVLQQASLLHPASKELASEYGRLALELDQVGAAKQLLELADDPAKPDWRVISARGTVLAKQGKYREAIPFYERALALVPDHPSVMNNLALAYTMSGEVAKAEALLRRASVADGSNPKVRQNLALVLGLQGKYDEASKVGSENIGPAASQANADLLRKIVKLEPKPMPPGVVELPAQEVATAATSPPAPWPTAVDKAQPAPPLLWLAVVDKAERVPAPLWPTVVDKAQSSPPALWLAVIDKAEPVPPPHWPTVVDKHSAGHDAFGAQVAESSDAALDNPSAR